MMINVRIDGYGNFQIDDSKIGELLAWLSKHEAARINEQNRVREVKDNQYTGNELLSE